jgi:hypothetical protein
LQVIALFDNFPVAIAPVEPKLFAEIGQRAEDLKLACTKAS